MTLSTQELARARCSIKDYAIKTDDRGRWENVAVRGGIVAAVAGTRQLLDNNPQLAPVLREKIKAGLVTGHTFGHPSDPDSYQRCFIGWSMKVANDTDIARVIGGYTQEIDAMEHLLFFCQGGETPQDSPVLRLMDQVIADWQAARAEVTV